MKIPMPQRLRRWLNIRQLKHDKSYVIPACCKLSHAGHIDMMLCWGLLSENKKDSDCKKCEFCKEEKV
jgi:hypothetical protein